MAHMEEEDANSVVFDKSKIEVDLPIPNGMVWNMKYDLHPRPGTISVIDRKEMWVRLKYFLDNILPVAEEAEDAACGASR